MLSHVTLARRAMQLSSAPAHLPTGNRISLDSGYASPEILPDLRAAASIALNGHRSESLQYGQSFGLPDLREWIASFVSADGIDVPPDGVLVVNGAKNGLELVCRVLLDEGDSVVVTAPTYFTALPILRSFEVEIIEVPQDEEGLSVRDLHGALERRARDGKPPPKFIYDVPDFHNPTGITMSRHRREELVAAAESFGIPIVEDTPYRLLRYGGTQEPSLRELDRSENVLALGTFSKLLAPGLRIGWVLGPRPLLERMARLKGDGGSCPLTQRIIYEFVKDGGLAAHLHHACSVYASHRDAIVSAVLRELPDATFTVPLGGYYLWLRFPDGVDSSALAAAAYEQGVSVIAGAPFYANGGAEPDPHLRLAFSKSAPPEIDEGVRLLAIAYRSIR